MDLNSILQATAHKLVKVPKSNRKAVYIAKDDRPYDGNKNTVVGKSLDDKSQSLDDKTAVVKKLKGTQLDALTHLIYYQISGINPNGISTKELSEKCGTSYYNLKTALHRLCTKKLVKRLKGKKAWYGFIKIYVFKDTIELYNTYFLGNLTSIYNNSNNNTITIKKSEEKISQTQNNSNKEHDIETKSHFKSNALSKTLISFDPAASNTSSNSESTQTTNNNPKHEELPEVWKNINYHLLDEIHLKPHHITDLYKLDVLSPEVIQESIEHFAYGIKHNSDNYKKYTDPLKVFYGSLRKGKPWTESTYKSTKQIATEDLIRRREVEKKKIASEICKLVEGVEKERYERWYNGLTEQEALIIKEKHKSEEGALYNVHDEKIYKLYYAKYVMEEYKDPSELALEEFVAKKKKKEEEEAKRIKKLLQESGLMAEYYKWAATLQEEEITKITEENGATTEVGQNKMIICYAKRMAQL